MTRLRKFAILAALAAMATVTLASPSGAQDGQGRGRADEPWWGDQTAGVQVNGSYIPIAGDFASTNPQDDIIWYAPGAGQEQVWISLNNGTFAKQKLQQQVNGTYEPIVGDFSGDNLDDILWYGRGTKPDVFWKSTASHTFQALPISINGDYLPVVLEDILGKDNILWWRSGAGASPLWSFTGVDAARVETSVTPPSASSGPSVGDFNGDGYDDIFWYAAGSGADRLAQSNGSGVFTNFAQTISGTYYPVVGQFSPTGGEADDILWFKFGGGTMALWESLGGGSWTKTNHSIPVDGNPIYAKDSWGYLHLWTEGGTDYIWYANNGGPDTLEPTGNVSPPAGYGPIPRPFVGAGEDIFWYKAGSATDRLFFY